MLRETSRHHGLLRIGVSALRHRYPSTLYSELAGRCVALNLGDCIRNGTLKDLDLVHIHWPEWSLGLGQHVDDHISLINAMKRAGVAIVVTAHNLLPHDMAAPVGKGISSIWYAGADAIIHHSFWGLRRVEAAYRLGSNCINAVVPHFVPRPLAPSEECVSSVLKAGVPDTGYLLVVGRKRPVIPTKYFLDEVAQSFPHIPIIVAGRIGIDLAAADLEPSPILPRRLDEAELSALYSMASGLVVPSDTADYLTSGLPSDALAYGLPVIARRSGYIDEYMDGDYISISSTKLESTLAYSQYSRSRSRLCEFRSAYEISAVALKTLSVLEATLEVVS